MRHLIFLSVFISSACLGGRAPQFRLPSVDGKEYELAKLLSAHAAVAVVFIATKCPYSNAYNERYNKLAEALKARPQKVALVAIDANDDEPVSEVRQHALDKKFTFPVLKDEGHRVADLFHAEKTPEAFLVAANGEVVYHGRLDDDTEGKNVSRQDLLAAIDETLGGKPVSVKETKAFGCAIIRK